MFITSINPSALFKGIPSTFSEPLVASSFFGILSLVFHGGGSVCAFKLGKAVYAVRGRIGHQDNYQQPHQTDTKTYGLSTHLKWRISAPHPLWIPSRNHILSPSKSSGNSNLNISNYSNKQPDSLAPPSQCNTLYHCPHPPLHQQTRPPAFPPHPPPWPTPPPKTTPSSSHPSSLSRQPSARRMSAKPSPARSAPTTKYSLAPTQRRQLAMCGSKPR